MDCCVTWSLILREAGESSDPRGVKVKVAAARWVFIMLGTCMQAPESLSNSVSSHSFLYPHLPTPFVKPFSNGLPEQEIARDIIGIVRRSICTGVMSPKPLDSEVGK